MHMTSVTQRWPRGTGQWNRTRVVIVSTDPIARDHLLAAWAPDHDVAVARSPLEVIRRLEADGPQISTIVISDLVGSAARSELAEFLRESYPFVRVIVTERPARDQPHDAELAAIA